MKLRKIKNKLPFIERLTYEINSITLKLQNFAIMHQMKMNGMKIEYAPQPWYTKAINWILNFTPLVIALFLIFNGHWLIGILVMVLLPLGIGYAKNYLTRIRFRIEK